jgi:TolA-binding protein
VKNLKKYLEVATANPAGAQPFQAKLLLGEIMFSKLGQYEQVIAHYQSLLSEKPDAPEAPELLFRIGKSHLLLWQFEKAVDIFQEVQKRFPKSPQAEQAAYETGVSYFTGGEQKFTAEGEAGIDAFQSAIRSFQQFLQKYPNSNNRDDAKLMIANCYEELDQLHDAYALLKEIEPVHSAKNLIRLRMRRIEQRLARKNK